LFVTFRTADLDCSVT